MFTYMWVCVCIWSIWCTSKTITNSSFPRLTLTLFSMDSDILLRIMPPFWSFWSFIFLVLVLFLGVGGFIKIGTAYLKSNNPYSLILDWDCAGKEWQIQWVDGCCSGEGPWKWQGTELRASCFFIVCLLYGLD